MNKDKKNLNLDDDLDLLEFLKYTLGCTYISDLRTNPYRDKAKLILSKLNLNKFSLKQLTDVFKYIYMNTLK